MITSTFGGEFDDNLCGRRSRFVALMSDAWLSLRFTCLIIRPPGAENLLLGFPACSRTSKTGELNPMLTSSVTGVWVLRSLTSPPHWNYHLSSRWRKPIWTGAVLSEAFRSLLRVPPSFNSRGGDAQRAWRWTNPPRREFSLVPLLGHGMRPLVQMGN